MNYAKFSDVVADNIVKLASLASVVDGQATDKEKNFIVDEASHLLRTSHDEVRFVLDLWIEIYQGKGAANNPGIALNFAKDALQPLSSSEKHLAFHLCEGVINIDKTVIGSELPNI